MLVNLINNHLNVIINTHGAEVTSIKDASNIEYLWQADKKFWGRHSPVLFPIVGRLKDDRYKYKDKVYSMGQHGFARDMDFEIIEKFSDMVVMILKSNKDTLKIYPFDFKLKIKYYLVDNNLKANMEVINEGKNEMLFSIGGHPAFNVPFINDYNNNYEDYQVEVIPNKEYQQIPFEAPYINLHSIKKVNLSKPLKLTHNLFYQDAKVMKVDEDRIKCVLSSDKSKRNITVIADNAEYAGLWAAKNAPFVCIEPWWGVADDKETSGQFENKIGLNKLSSKDNFKANYLIQINN
ncbi:aldose 1-epimerase family protein [Apilactobacillus apisilvae]|uniref:Aldose 1-epimerase family protein n=1 Tax=Apilactobacillus apisilvae TaxID=2923364 RepID=A0ABY4PIH0_9LACO|nr:aldose 1-epimerase family protein [Apilactobacillus apisilvae]UQS85402.1 aldose 1-epimerase family protein [Apilactobacillus apisilvae]